MMPLASPESSTDESMDYYHNLANATYLGYAVCRFIQERTMSIDVLLSRADQYAEREEADLAAFYLLVAASQNQEGHRRLDSFMKALDQHRFENGNGLLLSRVREVRTSLRHL